MRKFRSKRRIVEVLSEGGTISSIPGDMLSSRENGPSIVENTGEIRWGWTDGYFHREEGPAVYIPNRGVPVVHYYLKGECLTEEEFWALALSREV